MKKILIIFTLFFTLAAPLRAQMFMMDGEENYRSPEDPAVFAGLPDDYGMGVDWYVPIGDGLFLLTALGGVYLVGKPNKGRKE